MKRHVSSLLLGLGGVCLALLTSGGTRFAATAQKNPNELPYVLGGHTWKTKADFIEHGRCGTKTPSDKEIADVEAQLQHPRAPLVRGGGFVTVNVYVHIIRTDDGQGDVSDERISDQIAFLNKCYAGQDAPGAGQAPSPLPSASTPYRFVLAGIDRTDDTFWFAYFPYFEVEAKSALHQGNARDLNLYTANLLNYGLLGFATFPFWYQDDPLLDGVAIESGSITGGDVTPYNLGDTATHEVGHWLGLYHTFQGGCVGGTTNGGDFVSDTPSERGPFFGQDLPPYPNTCKGRKGRDPVENFMDYSDDIVMHQFTGGQARRANTMCLQYRGL